PDPEPVLPAVHVHRGAEGGAPSAEGDPRRLDPRDASRQLDTAGIRRAVSRPCLGVLLALGLAGMAAGCRQPAPPGRPSPAVRQPVAVGPAPPAGQPTGGWHLTVYYTPVESFHGPPLRPIADCTGAPLGQHSAAFLDHVQTEGYGRVATSIRGQRYLGWDFE